MAQSETLNLGAEGQILYDANKKSKLVAYLMWLFLGWVGAHRLYTRHIKSGLAMLATLFVGYGLVLKGIWPMMQQGIEAAQKAAESGEAVDPATIPQPDAAAVQAMVTDPLYLVGMGLLLIYTIWWIVDAFLIPGWIRRHNTELVASLRGR
jgi:hypothetical protein